MNIFDTQIRIDFTYVSQKYVIYFRLSFVFGLGLYFVIFKSVEICDDVEPCDYVQIPHVRSQTQ